VHRVQFVETDMAGIVHFSNFFRYMEEAEDAFLRSLNIELVSSVGDRPVSLPRLSTTCEFKSPAKYGDDIAIDVTVTELGRKTIRYGFDFSADSRPVATGEILCIYCEMTPVLKSLPLPAEIADRLKEFLIP
jgi:4-hydroxybenzoyl-CoA thioesterase/acyl-CoA thioester hydrolase